MKKAVHNTRYGLALVAVLLLLSACSKTKLIYTFSDWFLLHRIDGYFDLNKSQQTTLKGNIDNLLAWHRKSELSQYVKHLTELKERYQDGLSREDLEWIQKNHKTFWLNFLNRFLPGFSVFLATVDDSQIEHLKVEMEERSDWLIKQTNLNEKELHQDISIWFFDTLEDWLGELSPQQKEKISSWIVADREWVLIKIENRRAFSHRFTELLKSRKEPSDIEKQLEEWVNNSETIRTSAYQKGLEQKKKEWEDILLKIDSITTDLQRKNALEQIKKYLDDFTELANDNV